MMMHSASLHGISTRAENSRSTRDPGHRIHHSCKRVSTGTPREPCRHVWARSSPDDGTDTSKNEPEPSTKERSVGEPPWVISSVGPSLVPESGANQKRQADSTDWISSQLTRRFGVIGGFAWLGFLTFGVISEQIKTRLEVSAEKRDTRAAENAVEVTTSSGVRYTDLQIGGGTLVQPGYLMLLSFRLLADGKLIDDTTARNKPIVFIYGSRPFTGGICAGVEEALAGMRAGGKRRVFVPPALGFGDRGTVLRPTEHVPDKQAIVPPGATLEYELGLERVSIPPS